MMRAAPRRKRERGWYCPECGYTTFTLGSGLINCQRCGSIGYRGYERRPVRVSCPQCPTWSGWDDGGVNDDLGAHNRRAHKPEDKSVGSTALPSGKSAQRTSGRAAGVVAGPAAPTNHGGAK